MKKQIIILSLAFLGTSIFSAETDRNKKELLAIRNDLAEKLIKAREDRINIHNDLHGIISKLVNNIGNEKIDTLARKKGISFNKATIIMARSFVSSGVAHPEIKALLLDAEALQEKITAIESKIQGLRNNIIELNEILQR